MRNVAATMLCVAVTRVSCACDDGCSARGVCVGDECVCNPGYVGRTCAMDQLQCNTDYCKGRGTCNVVGDTFSCTCAPECGWSGSLCTSCTQERCPPACPSVPSHSSAVDVPGAEGSGSALPWWVPLAIVVPVLVLIIGGGCLLRQVVQLRKAAEKDARSMKQKAAPNEKKPVDRKASYSAYVSARAKYVVEDNHRKSAGPAVEGHDHSVPAYQAPTEGDFHSTAGVRHKKAKKSKKVAAVEVPPSPPPLPPDDELDGVHIDLEIASEACSSEPAKKKKKKKKKKNDGNAGVNNPKGGKLKSQSSAPSLRGPKAFM